MGFSDTRRPSVHGSPIGYEFCTAEVGGRAELQSACREPDALKILIGNKTARRHDGERSSRQWANGSMEGRAALRALAPSVVHVVEPAQESARVHRAPTPAPLSDHSFGACAVVR